jgi:hypothetical protein
MLSRCKYKRLPIKLEQVAKRCAKCRQNLYEEILRDAEDAVRIIKAYGLSGA